MFFFKRSVSLVESGLFRGFTDWHCHLLPGVDDGVRTLEETLRVLSLYETLGVKEVWLTPHVMEDVPNEVSDLKARFEELRTAYKGPVTLYLASENMLDNLFEERLERNELLPLGKAGDHLLVETSYFNPPMDLCGILRRVQAKGYHPVLAHPERYTYMEREDYKRLKSEGVKFQLDLFSLAGYYGTEARKKAEWLLKEHLMDLSGTDTHSFRMVERGISCRLFSNSIRKLMFEHSI